MIGAANYSIKPHKDHPSHAIYFDSGAKYMLAELGQAYIELAIEVHPSFLYLMLVKLHCQADSSRKDKQLVFSNMRLLDHEPLDKSQRWEEIQRSVR